MELGITGKVAFVSGGSNGMGRATAELFGREGCKVVVAALPADKESIDETVEAIRDAGGEAIGVAADLTVRDEVEQAVATATSALGPPDIAVCNVGGPPPGNFFDVTDEAFVKALDQMTMSMVYLCRAVIPHMREQKWGRIVNLNSVGAKEPPPQLAHVLVNPSRAAVIALNKTLSNEFAADGITVNTIGTGFIGTDRMLRYMENEATRPGHDPGEGARTPHRRCAGEAGREARGDGGDGGVPVLGRRRLHQRRVDRCRRRLPPSRVLSAMALDAIVPGINRHRSIDPRHVGVWVQL